MKIQGAGSRFAGTIVAAAAVCLIGGAASALPASERDTTYAPGPQASPIVLFFEPGSSEVPASARPIANRALAEGIRASQWHVRVEPYTLTEGGEEERALAEQRARNLVAFLVANGIPQSRVEAGPVRVTERLDPGLRLAGERIEVHFRPDNAPVMAGVR